MPHETRQLALARLVIASRNPSSSPSRCAMRSRSSPSWVFFLDSNASILPASRDSNRAMSCRTSRGEDHARERDTHGHNGNDFRVHVFSKSGGGISPAAVSRSSRCGSTTAVSAARRRSSIGARRTASLGRASSRASRRSTPVRRGPSTREHAGSDRPAAARDDGRTGEAAGARERTGRLRAQDRPRQNGRPRRFLLGSTWLVTQAVEPVGRASIEAHRRTERRAFPRSELFEQDQTVRQSPPCLDTGYIAGVRLVGTGKDGQVDASGVERAEAPRMEGRPPLKPIPRRQADDLPHLTGHPRPWLEPLDDQTVGLGARIVSSLW